MIDTLSDGINIKELAVAEPVRKPDLPFVPERDIPPGKWEDLKRQVNMSKTNEKGELVPVHDANFLFDNYLASGLILFPEKKEELEIPPAEHVLSVNASLSAEFMKIIFPSIPVEDLKLRMKVSSFDDYKNALISERGNVNYWLNMGESPVFGVAILYPERFGELKEIPGLVETFEEAARDYRENRDWGGFAEFKFAIKLLGRDPEITETDWKSMREFVGNPTSFDWDHAATMKMLEAKEVKMTPQGLQVIMPENENQLADVGEPLPERRKF